MSTLRWKAIREEGVSLPSSTPSSKDKLEIAFGKFPLTLDGAAIHILTGMYAADQDSDPLYLDLIKAIQRFGPIKVWAAY